MDLTIGWLYSGRMNIYGDRGNVLALERRARWRGLSPTIRTIEIGDPIPAGIDIFFFGGGQDQEQADVAADLAGAKGEALKTAVADGAAMLAVCGGYQFLGHEYRPHQGPTLPGIGVFDLVTIAGSERFIGNVVVDTPFGEVVGFENHSGLTTLGPGTQPLGTVRIGRGNNGRDGTEGAISRNAAGCYLHGAVLPKNPAFADWLLLNGLRHRHGPSATLPPLDDTTELTAQREARGRAQRRM